MDIIPMPPPGARAPLDCVWECMCACFLTYCALAIISLITTLRHSFSCQRRKDERQMIFVSTKTLLWFPPASFLSQTAKWDTKHDLFWLPFKSPIGAPVSRLACIVFRYGLDHIDCACGFPGLVKMQEGEEEKCWIDITRAIYFTLLKGISVREGYSPFTERLLFEVGVRCTYIFFVQSLILQRILSLNFIDLAYISVLHGWRPML